MNRLILNLSGFVRVMKHRCLFIRVNLVIDLMIFVAPEGLRPGPVRFCSCSILSWFKVRLGS